MQKDVKSDSKILKIRKFLRSLLIKFYCDEIKENHKLLLPLLPLDIYKRKMVIKKLVTIFANKDL